MITTNKEYSKTDNDVAEFYCKKRFVITEFSEDYDANLSHNINARWFDKQEFDGGIKIKNHLCVD